MDLVGLASYNTMFLRLAETVTAPFHANAAGRLPMDLAFDQLRLDVTVTYHMLPIPMAKSKDDDGAKTKAAAVTKSTKKQQGKPSPSAGAKGNTKGNSKNRRQPMPSALHGMHHKTPEGKAICFNYNLGKCSNKNCPREHVCCVPICYQSHPQFEHEMQ